MRNLCYLRSENYQTRVNLNKVIMGVAAPFKLAFCTKIAVFFGFVYFWVKKLKYFFVQRRGRIAIEYHKKDIWFIALIGREKGLQ